MIQGVLETSGPLWGWDGNGKDDWGGAVLTLLALAVVAATALALHWFGSGQDQDVAGHQSTSPRDQPLQVGAARPSLQAQSKFSGLEGQSSGQGKPDSPGRGQGVPAPAGAHDQGSPRGSGLALLPLKMPSEVASRVTVGQQRDTTPGAPREDGSKPPKPDGDFLGRSKAGGTPTPLLIHFTPRSPGCEAELQVDASNIGARGRGRSGRRRRGDAGLGDRCGCPARPDPLRLGAAASVWDAVDAAVAAWGTQGARVPEEGWPWVNPGRVPGPGNARAEASGPAGTEMHRDPCAGKGAALPKESPSVHPSPSVTHSPSIPLRLPPSPSLNPSPCLPLSPSIPLRLPPSPSITPRPSLPRSPSLPPSPSVTPSPSLNPSPSVTHSPNLNPSLSLPTSPSLNPSPSSNPSLNSNSSLTSSSNPSLNCKFNSSVSPNSGPRKGVKACVLGAQRPGGDRSKEKHMALLPPAAMPVALSQPVVQVQPGPTPPPTVKEDSQPVPRWRKRSMCEIAESSEKVVSQAALGEHQGQGPGDGASSAGSRGILTEKQKEAQKLMVFLQRPRSWGVVEEPRIPRSQALESTTAMALWPQRLDLDSCLEVLAFAQRHGEPGLAQETYALMSSNLLRVLGDPHLYRQLSGAEREHILSLRTGQGQAVLGVLVLPSLYQVGRSGLVRGSHGEEAPVTQLAPTPARTHLHVFNTRENMWRPLTQVPEEAPLRGCGLCTMYNYLFLAGGIRGSGAKAVCSNEVFCYNPLTNIWSQVRPMQQARAQLKLVALDGLLYAIGGECLYSMECYDPRTDAWTSRAPLPAGTFPVAHEAVACRGDIYVTGGHLFYRLLRYSPVKDSWEECPYSASHRRSSDMVALGGFLYRFDLLRGVGAAVMRYNTVTGSWSRAASLPLPDPAPLHCAVLGNTIYCLNHRVTATFTVSEGTAQFQAKELQPFPLGSKGVLCPFILTLPSKAWLQTSL
ncbi:kelch domain-containing protein 7B [Erethizon dorsatum]